MNTLDIFILILFVPGIVRGLSKGFVEQTLSLLGIILSVYMAYHYHGSVYTWLSAHFEISQTVLHIVGFAIVLAGVLIVILLLANLITTVVEKASLGWLNRSLGVVLSIIVTALVLSVIILLFNMVNVKFGLVKSPILQDSLLYGALKDLGNTIFPYLKGLVQ
jgi:membrane protein required for colicin V production